MNREEAVKELLSIDKEIKLRKAFGDRLCHIYYDLPEILEEHPDLDKNVFAVWNKAIESPRNTQYSIEDTFSSLQKVLETNPKMAPQVLTVFEKALSLENNDFGSICEARPTFLTLTDVNPILGKRAATMYIKALDALEDRMTPKSPLKKFWYFMNDIDGQGDKIKNSIREMRAEAKKISGVNPQGKSSNGRSL